jgi:hypothetical protein
MNIIIINRPLSLLSLGGLLLFLWADDSRGTFSLPAHEEQALLVRARQVVETITGVPLPEKVPYEVRMEEREDTHGCEGTCANILFVFRSERWFWCGFDTNGVLRTYRRGGMANDTSETFLSRFVSELERTPETLPLQGASKSPRKSSVPRTRVWGASAEEVAANVLKEFFPGYVGLKQADWSRKGRPFVYSKVADGLPVLHEFIRVDVADDLEPESITNHVRNPYAPVTVDAKVAPEEAIAIALQVAENEPRRRSWRKYYPDDPTGYVPRVVRRTLGYAHVQPNWEFVGSDWQQGRFAPQEGQGRRWVYQCWVCYAREPTREMLSMGFAIWIDVQTGEVMGGERGAAPIDCLQPSPSSGSSSSTLEK